MTFTPPPTPPEYPPTAPWQPGPVPPQPRSNTGLIIGVVAGVLVLCLAGLAIGGIVVFNVLDGSPSASGRPSPASRTTEAAVYSPPPVVETTEAAPPPAPVRVGDCVAVDTSGNYLGLGNCNGSSGTYRVLSVDHSQRTCADPDSPYITVDGYRLCMELYLVRNYCYKLPAGSGWVTAAAKCKAKGTVHVIDIVPGAKNGDRCTRDYKWNHWYRYTHPTVVYCVMKY
ncbi:hypothetical protein [Catellatospora sp. NPDC049609]|uniref:hypothetical protein n=1 Tax=Catellatospora sp. NPDC049609 TaxID=3155505 RepID=UPI003435B133